jgi:hypothetical protein
VKSAFGRTWWHLSVSLAGELPQEFLFIHVVLERFASVDEDDGDLVVVLAAEVGIRVNIHIAPLKAAALMEFDEALLDDFAKMAALAGIYDDFPMLHNSGSVAGSNPVSKRRRG